jgi:nitrilase
VTPESESFVVTAVQAEPVFLDLAASLDEACRLIEQAGQEGARLAVFPETWLTGYPVWLDAAPGSALWDAEPAKTVFRRLLHHSPTLTDPAVQQLGRAARHAGVVVVMGLHERRGGTLYNTMAFIGPKECPLAGGLTRSEPQASGGSEPDFRTKLRRSPDRPRPPGIV